MPHTLTAVKRTVIGKQSKNELKESRIPAVIYGRGIETRVISVPSSDFFHVFKDAGYSALIDIALEKDAPVKALVKEVQVHPLTMKPTHIDFLQVRMDEELTAEIPIVFVGESKAVKVDGGTLVKSLDKLEVRCLPANLPHEIQIDLGALVTFDDAIAVGDLKLPAGVKAETDANVTIATVARPLSEEELKKLEESEIGDVTAVKSEADEKKAAEELKAAEEKAAEETAKPAKPEKK